MLCLIYPLFLLVMVHSFDMWAILYLCVGILIFVAGRCVVNKKKKKNDPPPAPVAPVPPAPILATDKVWIFFDPPGPNMQMLCRLHWTILLQSKPDEITVWDTGVHEVGIDFRDALIEVIKRAEPAIPRVAVSNNYGNAFATMIGIPIQRFFVSDRTFRRGRALISDSSRVHAPESLRRRLKELPERIRDDDLWCVVASLGWWYADSNHHDNYE